MHSNVAQNPPSVKQQDEYGNIGTPEFPFPIWNGISLSHMPIFHFVIVQIKFAGTRWRVEYVDG